MEKDQFWSNVKLAILAANTQQESVAKHCEINLRTFENWIYRDIMPDVKDGEKIAHFLGVSLDYLVTGESPEKITPGALRLAKDYDRLDEVGQENVRGNMAGMLATHRRVEPKTKKAASE